MKLMKGSRGNQDNEWHLNDFRMGINVPYVRTTKK